MVDLSSKVRESEQRIWAVPVLFSLVALSAVDTATWHTSYGSDRFLVATSLSGFMKTRKNSCQGLVGVGGMSGEKKPHDSRILFPQHLKPPLDRLSALSR